MGSYKLAEMIERAHEDDVTIELSDGTKIVVPPSELIPDSLMRQILKGEIDDDALAEALVGPDLYAKYIAEGGTTVLFWNTVNNARGATPGE